MAFAFAVIASVADGEIACARAETAVGRFSWFGGHAVPSCST